MRYVDPFWWCLLWRGSLTFLSRSQEPVLARMNVSSIPLGDLILIKATLRQGCRILLNTTNQISRSWPVGGEACLPSMRRTLGSPHR